MPTELLLGLLRASVRRGDGFPRLVALASDVAAAASSAGGSLAAHRAVMLHQRHELDAARTDADRLRDALSTAKQRADERERFPASRIHGPPALRQKRHPWFQAKGAVSERPPDGAEIAATVDKRQRDDAPAGAATPCKKRPPCGNCFERRWQE